MLNLLHLLRNYKQEKNTESNTSFPSFFNGWRLEIASSYQYWLEVDLGL
jgi:hypothetical protein